MVGKTISHYKVLEKIGQGGMGEVYLAEDSRLHRKVALKILPQHLSERAELRERFEREARAVSSLNHPHICTLYDIGEQDGIHYLVMEHLVGETLEARLEKGALPLEQTLQYAIQIADALDKAHRQGVVHRDLKPGNIMLVKSGAKLLDFGLAKLQAAETPTNLSALPTEQANLTAEGTILGTLQYMAPEQLEGKEADSRTDIFAFGAVVYEMATGKKAFEGKSQASLIAAIMGQDPRPMSELQSMTPPVLDRIVKRCLAKEPDDRWQTAADLMAELKWVTEGGSQPDVPAPVVSRRRNRERLTWGLVSLVVGVLVTLIVVWSLTPPASPRAVSRFAMVLPSDQQWTGTGRHVMALSSDGKHLVYTANNQLYLRAMDQLEATPIRGTEGAREPFFSPDGQWVGFYASGQLKKVSISGGAPVTLCEAQNPFGATWGQDDTIVFGQGPQGIWKVSANGGTPEVLVTMNSTEGEWAHGPQILPGGEEVLFTLAPQLGVPWDQAQIVVQSLERGERRVLIEGGRDARYAPTGHLVYAQAGTLFAVPFDLGRLEVTGGLVPLVEGVMDAGNITGAAHFTFSSLGSLVYYSGATRTENSLVWVDREGTERLVTAEKRDFTHPRVSPDGRRLAFAFYEDDDNRNVWIYDIERDSYRRLTFEGIDNSPLIWSSDGNWITFQSDREGPNNIYQKAADGSGPAERLTTSQNPQIPTSWSPDGSVLAFHENFPETGNDILLLPMEGDGKPQLLISSPSNDCCARFSPDGQWLAYVSDETGQTHVYVSPYPEPNVKYLVSGQEGGGAPVWSPDGTELFYQSGAKMMVVSVETDPTFNTGRPQELFEGSYRISTTNPGFSQYYDISTDGQRFLMIKQEQQGEAQLNVVLNWFEELKRLVPTP